MKKFKKKKIEKFLEVHLDIYRLTVIITWETSKKEIMDYAIKHGVPITEDDWGKEFSKHIDNKTCIGLAILYGDDNSDVLVWLKKRPEKCSEYGVLYHELYHAVDSIIESRNLFEEKESPAFIYEYLAMECNNYFWSKK